MNTQSFERQLQQIDSPAPNPVARVRARQAAVAEFERLHPQDKRQPASRRWVMPRLWLGGFATACVAIVGVSVFLLAPEKERQIHLPTPAQVSAAAPTPVAEPATSVVTTPPLVLKQGTAARVASARVQQPAGSAAANPRSISAIDDAGRLGSAKVAAAIAAQMPQNLAASQLTGGGGKEESADHDAFFIGNTIANLRGTDPTFGSRTLTLVDGRRVVSTSDQADVVDLNTIPSNLLERMDVVTGGASATYGSAATAGTVNLALQQQSGGAGPRGGGAAGSGGAPRGGAAPAVTVQTVPEPPASPAPPALSAARAAAGSGRAGTDDIELADTLVTGTRILSPNATSPNPITSITREEMQRLGVVNVADALTQLVPSNISTYMPSLTGYSGSGGSESAGGQKFEQFVPNEARRTVDAPESTFSIDVDTSSYSFVRRRLNEGALPQASEVRAEEMINYFDYNWPVAESRNQPFKPTVTVSDSPWGEGRKLVHIAIKGYELPAKQRPDVNLVLLLDVSGSMAPADRLPLAQRSVAMLLDSLKPTDTVGIVVYAGRAGEVLPPTPVRDKDAILQALYSLHAGGGTAGGAGIQLAYEMAERNFRKGGVNRILLATDGDFNVGISDTNQLKRFVEQQRGKGVFLSVLGFGEDNYRDDISQALAQNGNGVAAYIDSLAEARKVLVQQAGSQLFTIAKDVKIQVEFNPSTVAEYRLIGYETRALKREDFNNDKVDAGDVGAGHTVTAIYEITPVGAATRQADERRYGADEKPAPAAPATAVKADEYGYLKIRYKLPDEDRSRLIEQPIGVKTGVPAALRQDVAFSTAVASFAQLLQGGRYTGAIGYDDVYRQAQGALGEDPHGYRAEFLQLVRKAQNPQR